MSKMNKINTENALKGKRVIVGVTGGVAAYKAVSLCNALSKHKGAEVIPVMTRGAHNFVNANTFRANTGLNVVTEVWEEPYDGKIAHIHLADTSDFIVIAPATAHFIAKHANGLADDMLSNILLATSKRNKILFCPAMNVHMWQHPATQRNIELLESYGINVMKPVVGQLACGYEDEGALPETKDIIDEMDKIIKINSGTLFI